MIIFLISAALAEKRTTSISTGYIHGKVRNYFGKNQVYLFHNHGKIFARPQYC